MVRVLLQLQLNLTGFDRQSSNSRKPNEYRRIIPSDKKLYSSSLYNIAAIEHTLSILYSRHIPYESYHESSGLMNTLKLETFRCPGELGIAIRRNFDDSNRLVGSKGVKERWFNEKKS